MRLCDVSMQGECQVAKIRLLDYCKIVTIIRSMLVFISFVTELCQSWVIDPSVGRQVSQKVRMTA